MAKSLFRVFSVGVSCNELMKEVDVMIHSRIIHIVLLNNSIKLT